MRRMPKTRITLTYATPVLHQRLDDTEQVNQRLREVILERAAQSPSEGKSNVGGWHSDTDIFNWPVPEIQQLLGWVGGATKALMAATTGQEKLSGELDAWGWANVLYSGGYNTPHIHADSMWSGAYYVDTGEPEGDDPNNGIIEFMDPRPAIDMVKVPGTPFTGRYRVAPQAGDLVMFPSWLYHFVNPYTGRTPRISIAFNIRIINTNLPASVFGGAIQYTLLET